ncbi:hypothetical protein AAKU52_002775 [Pedobacter sp. CG_S7]
MKFILNLAQNKCHGVDATKWQGKNAGNVGVRKKDPGTSPGAKRLF